VRADAVPDIRSISAGVRTVGAPAADEERRDAASRSIGCLRHALCCRAQEGRLLAREEDKWMRVFMSVVLIVMLGLGAGCRSMTGESASQNIDDATITTQVKAKLAAEKVSNLTRVSVATANGNVSLTGVVPTATDRARAEEIARGVKGVQGVANNLQVEKP
jgi:hyperosmotically inducible periplasmic protein